ncbi:alpha/beta-hydrolase [Setomelanomma holmii]|uniref:Carboxylic ester hydrolase n=1 Tax=Setomelanomma holmii TaxID=210430 RepID=A0A9P4LI52_9PLEO|nr:alpha/beta-hydrolase [Setomelanomma holmii]
MSDHECVIQHSTLQCSLRGKSSATSVQFRNLKYASIPGRYQDSIPNDTLKVAKDGHFDATHFGPSCPQRRGAQAWDLTLVGDVNLPCEPGQGETEEMDEFECLHVNVTVPKSALNKTGQKEGGLPVFAWVHGGGLSIGSNNWPQYDLQKIVERSVEIGKPIIGVAINYRVGLFGFMANEDLGANGNMGFKDQALAFKWIKKYIAGFGGDPNNVTVAGESAGGISLSTILCADVGTPGLFERVVIMSGDTTLRKPRNKWWHWQTYKAQSAFFGLKATDSCELSRTLLDTDVVHLTQKLPFAAHYCGYIDGEWLKEDVSLLTLANGSATEHKPLWCKEFVVGDTAHDGTVLKARILDQPNALDRLKIACNRCLTAIDTSRLLAAYELDSNLSPEQGRDKLLILASELRFYYPTVAVMKGWTSTTPPRKATHYHFHVPNPFEGAYKGIASHELDVAFLLQNFNDQLSESNRKIAESFADRFIDLANGHGWCRKGKAVVFGEDGVVEVDEDEYDRVYRHGRGTLLDSIGAEKVWRVAEMWQGILSEDDERGAAKM